ncbi:multiple RNA-binding domain-containing protein 1-like [Vespa mandarinia]|uniref:multiple RNA-binding domain-containing protein 1-like n=1 Tax=Vespa mandarinia TaxID=7446 RepID=UPI001612F4F2|nr:multiple RNA-binding domain-containing protein 1-like [Vespa mandarinia]
MDKTKQRQSNNKNGLSWIYRKKAKLRRAKNITQNEDADTELNNSATRIFVRNLPCRVKEEDIKRLYEKYGEIQEIILPCQSNSSLIGYAFIKFKRMQDASKAIFNTNKKEFFGRIITSGWVVANSKLYKKMKNISEINNKNKFSFPSSKRQNTDIKKGHKSLTLRETDISKH